MSKYNYSDFFDRIGSWPYPQLLDYQKTMLYTNTLAYLNLTIVDEEKKI
jgi:hypothetical protein